MLSNPVADPLFWPTARTLGAILGLGLALLLVAECRHLGQPWERVLFQRWAVWAVIAPIYALAVLGGPTPLLILVALLVWQALREYSRLVGLPTLYVRVLILAGLAILPLALHSAEAFFGILPLILIVATLQPLLTRDVQQGVRHLSIAVFGFAYLPLLLGHFVLIHTELPGGAGVLLVLGLATALSDVGAFAVGKLFGRHRLSPTISPNKTWEGVAGNLLGAYAGAWLLSFAVPEEHRVVGLFILPAVVAVGAVWGDLVESLIKREFGTKDAGAWLPGFGGLLDRVDSLVVTTPLAYHLLRALS
ncbi:MAG: phosphatidate cytidylyltransferase [Chloroflexota bacterium]|nr:phosphatidate cytidylyltransferase [Chloroflexota bacterium]